MKDFDVIVLGATGYTGRLVCEYLRDRARETGQRWAVAGRRKDALDELAAQYGADGALVADCTSPDDCQALAGRGKVIINIAGPYYERAENVVEACARGGVHYLDLTGELVFVRGIIDRFHATARESGAKIAPVAGYEALPFDLMAMALLEKYTAAHGENPERIDLLAGSMQPPPGADGMGAMISGGTAETMRMMLEKDFSGLSSDPTALNAADDPNRDAIRAAMAYRLRPAKEDLEANSAPIFPGPFLHPAVVNRSFAMLREEQIPISTAIQYRERMSLQTMASDNARPVVARLMAAVARLMAWLTATSLRWPRRIAKRFMDKNAPHPGEGPDLATIDDWSWSLRGVARGAAGASVEMSLTGKGHPGYRTTANMIAEAGLILADDTANTPHRAGVLTPAAALGVAELGRFARAGMAFSG